MKLKIDLVAILISKYLTYRVIFLGIDFRDIFKRLENRCINKKSGTFMSLDQAVNELKSGILKIEHLGLYQLDLEKRFCEYQKYSNHLKVSYIVVL